jgi:hypothetical protein
MQQIKKLFTEVIDEFDWSQTFDMISDKWGIISNSVQLVLKEEERDFSLEEVLLINDLRNKIYDKYRKAEIKKSNFKEDIHSFEKYFKEKFKDIQPFTKIEHWQFNEKDSVLRKESEQFYSNPGRFFLQEKIKITDDSLINKSSLIIPRFDFAGLGEFKDWFWVYGKKPQLDNNSIRFYFNIFPDKKEIWKLIKYLFKYFDTAQIPFTFKFAKNPNDYPQYTDIAVLYVPRKHVFVIAEILNQIYHKLDEKFFHNQVPLFTRKIKKGLGFGENPFDGRFSSFGSYRSTSLALAAFKTYSDGRVNFNNFIEKLNSLYEIDSVRNLPQVTWSQMKFNPKIEIFTEIDSEISTHFSNVLASNSPNIRKWSDSFYLNKEAKYDYKEVFSKFKPAMKLRKESFLNFIDENNIFLQAAILYGYSIAKEAVWFTQDNCSYCTWLSFSGLINSETQLNKNEGNKFNSVDNSFINGRLGIVFFLIKLNSLTSDNVLLNTAIKGIEIIKLIKPEKDLKNENEIKWFKKYTYQILKEEGRLIKILNSVRQDGIGKSFSFDIKRQVNQKVDLELMNLIIKVLTSDYKYLTLSYSEKVLVNDFINNNILIEKPTEKVNGSEEFVPTFNYGKAFLGYFFLRLYDPYKFEPIPLKVI